MPEERDVFSLITERPGRKQERIPMTKVIRTLGKIVFSRTMITILLMLVQVLVLFSGFRWMNAYMNYILIAFTVLGAVLVVVILNRDENPAYKLAWVIPLCVIPVFGALLYLFVVLNPGAYGMKLRLAKRLHETEEYLHTTEAVKESLAAEDTGTARLASYIERCGGYPAYCNTKAMYFASGEEKFEQLLKDLKNAEHFIFLEYFIIEEGRMWNTILEVLKEKAAQGVEVRVMYDGMCSILLLPYSYPKKLKRLGIRAKMFAPIRPALSTHQNNRDHRKIFVIDGRVAYTGGINLADEYINEAVRFGHWKDAAIRVAGDAVDSFTLMFLQMWNVTEEGGEKYDTYLRKNLTYLSDEINSANQQDQDKQEMGYVIPYGDAPNDREQIGENVYLDILYTAKRYVHIMTPYLIIDNEMMTALAYAAKRGVDVKLILPHIPDKKTAFSIARTYYPALLRAGVKLYEYEPGFVHAKCFVSDDEKAVVGTINLDYRSLFLHYECAAFLYRNKVVADIEADYRNTLLKCITVDMKYYEGLGAGSKLMGHVLRMFGPLM